MAKARPGRSGGPKINKRTGRAAGVKGPAVRARSGFTFRNVRGGKGGGELKNGEGSK